MIDQIKLNEINLREEALWGAAAIARLARCSVDLIYDWEKLPDCPISKPGGRYFVLKTVFIRWLTAKNRIEPDVAITG